MSTLCMLHTQTCNELRWSIRSTEKQNLLCTAGYATVQNVSIKVRDLVAVNGELKLSAHRAKAEIAVLKAERRGLEGRFLLRSPSPPPTPPVGDTPAESSHGVSGSASTPPWLVGTVRQKTQDKPRVTRIFASDGVADDGNIDGMDRVQCMTHSKSNGEVVATGGNFRSSTGLDESKVVLLNDALPNGGFDDADSNNHPIHAPGRDKVGGAVSGCSRSAGSRCNWIQGSIGAKVGDSGKCCSKAIGGEASGLVRNTFEQDGDGDVVYENNSGSDGDAENVDSRELDVCSMGALSRPSKDATSGDSDSNKCNTREKRCMPDISTMSEQQRQHRGPSEPSDGVSCGVQVALPYSTAQAASSAVDDAVNFNVTRPGNGHNVLSKSLPPQHTWARLISDNTLFGVSMGDSGTRTVASTDLLDNSMAAQDGGHVATQSRRQRTDTSTLGRENVVEVHTSLGRYGSHEPSVAQTSVCEAESGMWPSASFIAAKASTEDTSDDENSAQVTVEIPPREETPTVTEPSPKPRQRENNTHDIINYFFDSSSQSSSNSRSPGG